MRARYRQQQENDLLTDEEEIFQDQEQEDYDYQEEEVEPAPPPYQEALPRSVKSPGPAMLLIPGILCLVGAGGLGFLANSNPSLGQTLQTFGVTPTIIGLFGAALIAASVILKGIGAANMRIQYLEETTQSLSDQNETIRTGLADLGSIDVAAKLSQVAAGMAPSEIKSALTKNDEKLNNLTKATRMFTQPLEEISDTIPEISQRVQALSGTVEEATRATEKMSTILEEFGTNLPNRTAQKTTEQLPEIVDRSINSALEPLKATTDKTRQSMEEAILDCQKELEEALGSLRLGLSEEVNRCVDQVGNQVTTLNDQMQQKAELNLTKIQESLDLTSKQLDTTITGKMSEIGSPGGGDEGTLESVNQILEMVRSLDYRIQNLPAAPAGGAPAAQPEPATVAAAPQPAPPPAKQGNGKGGGSVLSSIQKLKQMRGK